jgi:hypothetical protein
LRPVLWEVADIVEQIFRIAFVEDLLHPRPEEFDAATCDYQADHGLSMTGMREAMRQYGTLTEIHERAQVIALMRLYARCWRPLVPEGGMKGARLLRSLCLKGFWCTILPIGARCCTDRTPTGQKGSPTCHNILIQQSFRYFPPL